MANQSTNDKSKAKSVPRAMPTQYLPHSDIYFPKEWNGRAASRYAVADPTRGTMADFSAGLVEEGQRTPIDVRPNPWQSKDHPQPFAAVTGFRRGEAIHMAHVALAKENEGKKGAERRDPKNTVEQGLVCCYVHDPMTEEEAVVLNAVENLDRLDLESADLAFSVIRVCKALPGKSQVEIGKILDRSGTHVGLIQKIGDGCTQDVLDAWRVGVASTHPLNPTGACLSLSDMKTVAECGTTDESWKAGARGKDKPADQAALFTKLCAAGGKKGGAGRGNWHEGAKKQAGEIGAILGTLTRLRHIDASEIEWHGALFGEKPGDSSPVGIKWHKEVSELSETGGVTQKAQENRAVLAAAAVAAYAAAVTVKTDEEVKVEVAMAEAAKNGGGAAAASGASAAS